MGWGILRLNPGSDTNSPPSLACEKWQLLFCNAFLDVKINSIFCKRLYKSLVYVVQPRHELSFPYYFQLYLLGVFLALFPKKMRYMWLQYLSDTGYIIKTFKIYLPTSSKLVWRTRLESFQAEEMEDSSRIFGKGPIYKGAKTNIPCEDTDPFYGN